MRKIGIQKGFTLIELMVVIVIIGILVAVVLPNFVGAMDRAKIASVKSNAHTLQVAVESFSIDSGGIYPGSMAEIEAASAYKIFKNPFTGFSGAAGSNGEGAWRTNNQGAADATTYNDDAETSIGHTQYTGVDSEDNATTRFGGNGVNSADPTVNYFIYACGKAGEIIPRFVLTAGNLTENAKTMTAQ